MEKDRGAKRVAAVMSIKRNIREKWETAIQERFAVELDQAKSSVGAMVDLGRKLGDMAGKTWQEATWADSSGTWKQGWSEADAMILDRGTLISNPAQFLAEIQTTIRDLRKQQR